MPIQALPSFDQLMNRLMTTYKSPGGSIALTRNGRLVFARGYGTYDAQDRTPVQPDSLFRIASLSKLITAVTVMHLVEQGKLSLDQPAFALLSDVEAPAGATIDSRLANITIRHLLNHSGGWDDTSAGSNFDPMFASRAIAHALNAPAPASAANIIRYMRGQPLQFNPGERFAYSNFGYAVLGRVIEHVTGRSYWEYVRTNVLAPMGISRMRLGESLTPGQGEVKYTSAGTTAAAFPGIRNLVPWAYGGWCLESMDSHGGWVASAIDYARFVNAIDGRRGRRFLSAASVAAITARPDIPGWTGQPAWYGFGVFVRPMGNGANWWHSGSLDGSAAYQVRTSDGSVWVILLNTRPGNPADQTNLFNDIDQGLWDAASQVTVWPSSDLFALYPDSGT
jgi:CubicO group peptidase (beta-lactamase class C family)